MVSGSISLRVGWAAMPAFDSRGTTLDAGTSLARAGAAAAPLPPWGVPLWLIAGLSNSVFPAASAARRRAEAMGSAIGVERGCQAYCFDCAASDTDGKLSAANGA